MRSWMTEEGIIRSRPETAKGFTLLEVTVAFGIIIIAVVGLYSILINTQMLNRLNREMQLATFAAQKQMAEVLAEDWETLPARDGEEFMVAGLELPQGTSSHGTIAVNSKDIMQNILAISVTVRWKNFNQIRTVTLYTFCEKK